MTSIVPREFLIQVIAQCMQESSISLDEVEQALDSQALSDINKLVNRSQVDFQAIVHDVREGKWDTALEPILANVRDLGLIIEVLDLLIRVLCAEGARDAARTILTHTGVMSSVLARKDPARYAYLTKLAEGSLTDTLVTQTEGEKARLLLATKLETYFKSQVTLNTNNSPQTKLEVRTLVDLIQDAARWRRICGKRGNIWDLNETTEEEETSKRARLMEENTDLISLSKPKTITPKFGKGVQLQCAVTSSDGETMAVGTSDGFIELFHVWNMKKRKDLAYQDEEPLFIDGPVTCLSFSLSNNKLAGGDSQGSVTVFDVQSGAKIRTISTGHNKGIASLNFSPDQSRLVTGGVDGACRVFSLASGTRLCECISHDSFVNTVAYISATRLLSGSSDEKCCLWNANTGELLKTFSGFNGKVVRVTPFKPNCGDGPPCHVRYGEMTHALISSTNRVCLLPLDGSAALSILLTRASCDVVDAVVSRQGTDVYCCWKDTLVQIDLRTKATVLEGKVSVGGQLPIGLCQPSLKAKQIIPVFAHAVALYA